MKIGVMGTGVVGSTIANKLVALGHEVKMGARSASNPKAEAWAKTSGGRGSQGTFADAAAFGEMLVNCTAGVGSLAALQAAEARNLAGKILIDVSNPLDFSKGMPPTLAICNTDSLGEQIQSAFPDAKVVKTLNTMTCDLMVDPSSLTGEHDVFVSGNDAAAKGRVTEILKGWFGWRNVVDLGDISTARGAEMLLAHWIRTMGALRTAKFNYHIVR